MYLMLLCFTGIPIGTSAIIGACVVHQQRNAAEVVGAKIINFVRACAN